MLTFPSAHTEYLLTARPTGLHSFDLSKSCLTTCIGALSSSSIDNLAMYRVIILVFGVLKPYDVRQMLLLCICTVLHCTYRSFKR